MGHKQNKLNWKTGYWVLKSGSRVHISNREKQCVDLLLSGYSMKMMAQLLEISLRTVEYYLCNVRNKLSCPNKFSLIRFIFDGATIEKVTLNK